MKRMIALAFIATCWTVSALAAEENANSRLEQARSLVASGKPAEALPIYDELTSSGTPDVNLLKEAGKAATAAHDMRRAAVYAERRLKADPNDSNARSVVAALWRLAGDEAQAKRSREEYIAYWKASTDPKVRAVPFLVIDQFRVGNATVIVDQCVEIAGDFGVGYTFRVYAPKGPPLPLDELLQNYRQRIVLEHNRLDQKVMSELKHADVLAAPTLDLLAPDRHATLRMFDSEPDYPTIRDLVGNYIAGEGDLSNKPPIGTAWTSIHCVTDSK